MHYLLKREKKADWEALDKIVIRREDVLSVWLGPWDTYIDVLDIVASESPGPEMRCSVWVFALMWALFMYILYTVYAAAVTVICWSDLT